MVVVVTITTGLRPWLVAYAPSGLISAEQKIHKMKPLIGPGQGRGITFGEIYGSNGVSPSRTAVAEFLAFIYDVGHATLFYNKMIKICQGLGGRHSVGAINLTEGDSLFFK